MIEVEFGTVTITNTVEDIEESIALLTDMRDFCKEQREEGARETTKALTVAIETMQAFWCEHFEDEDNETH